MRRVTVGPILVREEIHNQHCNLNRNAADGMEYSSVQWQARAAYVFTDTLWSD